MHGRRSLWMGVPLAVVLLAVAAWYLHTPTTTMLISSGDPGDVYFRLGVMLDDILEDAFPGFPQGRNVDFTNLPSHGAVDNVTRIVTGRAQLALAEEGIELDLAPVRGRERDLPTSSSAVQAQVRTLAQLFNSPLKILVRRDVASRGSAGTPRLESLGDLRTLIDLSKVAKETPLKAFIGAEGSGTRKVARLVLDHYGFRTEPASNRPSTADLLIMGDDWTFEQAKEALEHREIQIAFFLTAFGTNAVRDLAGKGGFALLGVDRAQGIHRSHPFMDVVTIPASSYPSSVQFPEKEIQTLAVDEVLIGSSALTEQEAYRIVETLFNHSHDLGSAFPFMVPLSKSDQLAQRFYYPPHPGATAFYQGRHEPQGLVDFLQRYRDVMLGLFSLGGSAWAIFHFFAGRWRSRPLVQRLRLTASPQHIYEIEHEASHLFATKKIDKETYEAVKEYVRVRLSELNRRP